MTELDAGANVLGALALIVTDRTDDAIAAAAGQSVTAAAALSALHHILDRPTVDAMGRVLGLTPSGAVRLVDRLAAAGYVTRGPGVDGRSRSVSLTRKGQRAAARVSAARTNILATALSGLSTVERGQLHGLLGRVLGALVTEKVGTAPGQGGWTCRLCDTAACGRPSGACPAANAAQRAIHPGS
jgi:DNA-binding MarR family transcriptional regulator